MEKSLYEIEIADLNLKIRSSLNESKVNEIVTLVDTKISESLSGTQNKSLQTAAILAALNLAEELIILKDNARDRIAQLEDKTQKVLSSLETSPMNQANYE